MPAPPPPPQDPKAPDIGGVRRKVQKPAPATLLTGPAGVPTGGLNTAGSTLLGA